MASDNQWSTHQVLSEADKDYKLEIKFTSSEKAALIFLHRLHELSETGESIYDIFDIKEAPVCGFELSIQEKEKNNETSI